jgi:hypothetical protein
MGIVALQPVVWQGEVWQCSYVTLLKVAGSIYIGAAPALGNARGN